MLGQKIPHIAKFESLLLSSRPRHLGRLFHSLWLSNFIVQTVIDNSLGERYNISYSYDANGKLVAKYTYDVDGMRTTKTVGNVTIAYYYDDSNLVAERRTTDSASSWLYYLYGVDGIAGFRYNSTTYLFRKNVQGDVTLIYTESGTLVEHCGMTT